MHRIQRWAQCVREISYPQCLYRFTFAGYFFQQLRIYHGICMPSVKKVTLERHHYNSLLVLPYFTCLNVTNGIELVIKEERDYRMAVAYNLPVGAGNMHLAVSKICLNFIVSSKDLRFLHSLGQLSQLTHLDIQAYEMFFTHTSPAPVPLITLPQLLWLKVGGSSRHLLCILSMMAPLVSLRELHHHTSCLLQGPAVEKMIRAISDVASDHNLTTLRIVHKASTVSHVTMQWNRFFRQAQPVEDAHLAPLLAFEHLEHLQMAIFFKSKVTPGFVDTLSNRLKNIQREEVTKSFTGHIAGFEHVAAGENALST